MAVTAAEVRELVESDVDDLVLERLIADADELVDDRVGPDGQQTVEMSGGASTLWLPRPADTNETITVEVAHSFGDWEAEDSGDWETAYGGVLLRHRSRWPHRVKVTYTPEPLADRRDRVIIDLVHLAVTYNGMAKNESAGDYSVGQSLTPDAYERERQKLVGSLVGGAPF